MSKTEHGSTNVYVNFAMPDAEEMLLKAYRLTRLATSLKKV